MKTVILKLRKFLYCTRENSNLSVEESYFIVHEYLNYFQYNFSLTKN